MHLVNSQYAFFIIIPFAVLAALIIGGQIRKSRLTNRIFSPAQKKFLLANYSQPLRILRLIALTLGLFFISFAVLDPRWGSRSSDFAMEGIDVILVMDVSQSMETPDVYPDRLEFSQDLAQQLLSLLVGNRVGIAAFAGYGFKVIPLTMDINAAIIFLNELSTGMIDVQGTNLEDAVKKAMELFQEEALTHKAIVLFTDGEDSEFDPMTEVEKAQKQGVSIFTVGMGTPEGGIIPLYDDSGDIYGYMEDEDGENVVSKLNEELLTEMAETTGGSYYEGTEENILKLGAELEKIEKSKFGSNIYEYMQPQYQYFLAIGLLLLFIYIFLPDRKLRRRNPTLAVLALLLLPGLSFGSDASEGVQSYRDGDFETALDYFQSALAERSDDAKIRFNEANTYYQLEKFTYAISEYTAINTDKSDMQYKIWYNIGNAFFEKQNISKAMEYYKKVLDSADPDSVLYQKAVNNFILAKELEGASSSSQESESGDQSDQEQEQDDQNGDQSEQNEGEESEDQQNQSEQDESEESDDQQDQSSSDDQEDEMSAITPTDIENLLNLIEEEEKQHLSEQEEYDGLMYTPQNKW